MDKLLFTPGPLTTSRTVKEAMLRDLGSRDDEFIDIVAEIRNKLLKLAGVNKELGYEAIIMQGSGTFGIEAAISSLIPVGKKLLVLINGVYGNRIAKIASIYNIDTIELHYRENEKPRLEDAELVLQREPEISNIAIVHCETTTGILNNIEDFGLLAAKSNKSLIVDAMSSFGAIPIDMFKSNISCLISSSNKCIEGVPGFSFVIVRHEELNRPENIKRSLSLDLIEQWKGLEKDGQFRFTPPTHAILAFRQALIELEEEGGITKRAERYASNHKTLIEGMRALGFETYLSDDCQSYIITSFYYPKWEAKPFDFKLFYKMLSDRGFIIYPGKLSNENCFRIGNIGRIGINEIKMLLENIKEVIQIMKA